MNKLHAQKEKICNPKPLSEKRRYGQQTIKDEESIMLNSSLQSEAEVSNSQR